MEIRNRQFRLKYFLIVFGMLFSCTLYSQSKSDAELFAIWKDSSKPETVRLEAIWERMDLDSLPNQEPEWWNKWKNETKEAIELALKHDKKGYLPLLYMTTLESYSRYNDTTCVILKKVIETAKLANAAKTPFFVLYAYFGLYYNHCGEEVKVEDVLNEFNKAKNRLSNPPADLRSLRQINFSLGEWFKYKQKYPQALTYLLESLRISEELQSTDGPYARVNELLGDIHTQIGNDKEAAKYIDKSLQMAYNQKDTAQLGSAFLVKSRSMLNLKDEVGAQRYIDSALYVMKNVKHCEPCYNVAKTINAANKNLSKNYSGALAELAEVEAFFNGEGKGQKPEPIFFFRKSKSLPGAEKI